MNHKYVILGIATIVAALAINAVGFAVPQQALAGGHHHHHSNGIKVDQVINQANFCNQTVVCANDANNNVDIDR